MRRWIEINVVGGHIRGGDPVTITGKENTWDPRTHTRQETNPRFISMPTKEQLVTFFQGMTGQGNADNQTLIAFIRRNTNFDAPANDCSANHLQGGYELISVGPYLQTIFFNGYAPDFNQVLFTEDSEPPSVNG